MKHIVKVALAVTLIKLGLLTANAESHAENVVLINTFTVPADVLEETIVYWEQARDFLKTQPGYVSTKLHQSLSPDAKYLLVNVAEWESADAFKAATTLMQSSASLPTINGVVPGPQLYKVIRN